VVTTLSYSPLDTREPLRSRTLKHPSLPADAAVRCQDFGSLMAAAYDLSSLMSRWYGSSCRS
jgi:hypothetical protein